MPANDTVFTVAARLLARYLSWRCAALAVAAGLLAAGLGCRRSAPVTPDAAFRGRPRVMLWSWQRPQRFGFLDPRRAGVAYLAQTIWLTGNSAEIQPNPDGLEVPRGTWLMACARIETGANPRPQLSRQQAARAAAAIAAMARLPMVRAVQVDFDATRSQRRFYRDLLWALRRRLPHPYPVSITALASWCAGDDWLEGLPINEAVPMLFQMGPERWLRNQFAAGLRFPAPLCRGSVGLSTAVPVVTKGNLEQYWFDPDGWTAQAYRQVVRP